MWNLFIKLLKSCNNVPYSAWITKTSIDIRIFFKIFAYQFFLLRETNKIYTLFSWREIRVTFIASGSVVWIIIFPLKSNLNTLPSFSLLYIIFYFKLNCLLIIIGNFWSITFHAKFERITFLLKALLEYKEHRRNRMRIVFNFQQSFI